MNLKTTTLLLTLFGVALAGQTASKPAQTAKIELALDGVSLAVYERSSSSPLTSTIKSGTKDSKVHVVDNQKKLQLKFVVKDAKKNEPVAVQQAFLAFVHKETEREVIFVAEPETGSKNYLIDLDFKAQEKNFDGLNGTYSLRLILGDSNAANAFDWNFADIRASFSEVVRPPPKKSQIINYDVLPEIKHKFREPEARPSAVISDSFTLICLAPLGLLLILWLRVGLNFGNIQFSLWALGFHVGLVAIFGLYFTFWVRLDMFETLKYLAFIGIPTFICGNRLLRSLNQSRNYGDFNNKIGQYAAVLNGKLGVTKGDRLIARTLKNINNIALYFATLRIGAIYIPLNPGYSERETKHFVNDSKPKVLVTCNLESDRPFLESVSHVISEDTLATEASKERPMLEVEDVTSLDIASVCYTSGTTGLPKGAMIMHGGISSNAESCADFWKFNPNDVQYHCLPSYHIHGLFISFNCSLLTRSSVIWKSKFTIEDTLEWLPKCTVMMGVPTYYHRLLHDPRFSKDTVKNIRLFVSGSAPLSPAVWEDFKTKTGIPILERYGMTETLVSTSNPYEHSGRVAGAVGVPLPGYQVRINKDEILEYKGPSIFKGYWNLPEKTKQEFTEDGWFITGDVARMDENGYVYIMGRGKDMIISGGLNVYPKEVEDVMDSLDIVKESAVVAAPHPDFGEAVVAVVVRSENGRKLDKKDFGDLVISTCKKELANYKIPKKVFILDELPRNAMGKVQKKQLREDYKNLFQ